MFKYGLTSRDLYNNSGLKNLDDKFLEFAHSYNSEIYSAILSARINKINKTTPDYSTYLISTAVVIEEFIIEVFSLHTQLELYKDQHLENFSLLEFKKFFIQKRAAIKYLDKVSKEEFIQAKDSLEIAIGKPDFSEIDFYQYVSTLQIDEEENAAMLELAEKYAAFMVENNHGQIDLFILPKKINFEHLFDYQKENEKIYSSHQRQRSNFTLNDPGISKIRALGEATYCIYCHNRDKDSCSKGLHDRAGNIIISEVGQKLNGCPLDQKISEMNYLKSQGNIIAALAVICLDNPMLAATGHRICNDCMKACIFQKQTPVNIPMVETSILQDVLRLDYGFEIYSLLTRWNPLKETNYLLLDKSGYKVLVAGLGPSGFALSHYLAYSGHEVTGIDGNKIEPLEANLTCPDTPIKNIDFILDKDLDERTPSGFGGVAEYGITVRWNKNYLDIIRLILERQGNFKLFGGVRLGSNITITQCFENMGYDHIALCLGAGKPNLPSINNALPKGARTASDFLMNLHSGGLFLKDSHLNSLSNMLLRLPCIVIGGGLTSIDAATEAKIYYLQQIKKFKSRYDKLIAIYSKEEIENNWSQEDKEIARELLLHARELYEEEQKIRPDYNQLIASWGGVKLAYRKSFLNSPAYRINHEEIEKALEEGIEFYENLAAEEFICDAYNHISKVKFKNTISGEFKEMPSRSVIIGIGTTPNNIIAEEDKEYFTTNGKFLNAVKNKEFICYTSDKGSISFFGDMHPKYSTSVVKAIAGSKKGIIEINEIVSLNAPKNIEFNSNELNSYIVAVNKLAPKIYEVLVHSKYAAQNFQPGQFYKLQNLSSADQPLMEPLALTGARVEKEKGIISLIVLEMGGSSNICKDLKEGQHVILMGPTGTPTEIVENKQIVLIGGGLGNAVLFSIGQALKTMGNKVIYFAGYRNKHDLFEKEAIELAADIVIWSCEEASIETNRASDFTFCGNIIEAMKHYSNVLNLLSTDRVIVIGSDKMMSAINNIKTQIFSPHAEFIASINSPMQCMMKEICGQCLQKHIDPISGIETYVFSCRTQDQDMNLLDFDHLTTRLSQNSLLEKLSRLNIK